MFFRGGGLDLHLQVVQSFASSREKALSQKLKSVNCPSAAEHVLV